MDYLHPMFTTKKCEELVKEQNQENQVQVHWGKNTENQEDDLKQIYC